MPAVKEAAATFGKAQGIEVQVEAGPLPAWKDKAMKDADIIFSGFEVMMSDFIEALPDIDPSTVQPLYLRASAILVRPGNPKTIGGVQALLEPGHRILVVMARASKACGRMSPAGSAASPTSKRFAPISRRSPRTAPTPGRRGSRTVRSTPG